MANLSKRKLSDKQLLQISCQLNVVLGKLSPDKTGPFLAELLGYEERIMIAKRFAMILMIEKGFSSYKISSILKVSTATAEKIAKKFDRGDYNQILSSIKKNKKDYLKILDVLDSALHLGGLLPHYGQTYRSEEYRRNKTF